jgi:hypothetical protein
LIKLKYIEDKAANDAFFASSAKREYNGFDFYKKRSQEVINQRV